MKISPRDIQVLNISPRDFQYLNISPRDFQYLNISRRDFPILISDFVNKIISENDFGCHGFNSWPMLMNLTFLERYFPHLYKSYFGFYTNAIFISEYILEGNVYIKKFPFPMVCFWRDIQVLKISRRDIQVLTISRRHIQYLNISPRDYHVHENRWRYFQYLNISPRHFQGKRSDNDPKSLNVRGRQFIQ